MVAPGMDLTDLIERYVRGLREAGMPSPLDQSLSVGAVLVDLCELAGVETPSDVRTWLDTQAPAWASGQLTLDQSFEVFGDWGTVS